MDDDEMVRFIAGQTLERLGFSVDFAEEGHEAAERYRVAMEAGAPFLAVILDLNIPGGMGGKEAVELIKAIDPEVKAFVTSGNSSDPVMVNYKEYGFTGCIEKPYFFFTKPLLAEFEQTILPKE